MGVLSEYAKKLLTVERIDFYALDLPHRQELKSPRMRLKVDFGFATEADIVALTDDVRLDAFGRGNFFRRKMQLGHRLLLGRTGGDIVFYLWVVTGRKILLDKILLLDPGEIAIERAFSRPDVRGHGLYICSLDYLLPRETASGFIRCLTEIARNNRPMVVTARKYGFARLDSGYYQICHPFRQHALVRGLPRTRIVRNDSGLKAWEQEPSRLTRYLNRIRRPFGPSP